MSLLTLFVPSGSAPATPKLGARITSSWPTEPLAVGRITTGLVPPPAPVVPTIGQFIAPAWQPTPPDPVGRVSTGLVPPPPPVVPTIGQFIAPAWQPTPPDSAGRITTGYSVAVVAPALTFAPAPVRPFAFPPDPGATGKIIVGLVPPQPPVVPVLGWRITPSWQPTPPDPVGKITTGYVVTTPVLVNRAGRGRWVHLPYRPLKPEEEELRLKREEDELLALLLS